MVEVTEKSEPGRAGGLSMQVKFFIENERGTIPTKTFLLLGREPRQTVGPEEGVISQLPAGYVSCLASGFSRSANVRIGARGGRAVPDGGPIQAIRTRELRGFGGR